jgi:hypothetical protein
MARLHNSGADRARERRRPRSRRRAGRARRWLCRRPLRAAPFHGESRHRRKRRHPLAEPDRRSRPDEPRRAAAIDPRRGDPIHDARRPHGVHGPGVARDRDVLQPAGGARGLAASRGGVLNLRNKAYQTYDIGVPSSGDWRVRLDTDWQIYGADFGGGQSGTVATTTQVKDGKPYTLPVKLGAYSAVVPSR